MLVAVSRRALTYEIGVDSLDLSGVVQAQAHFAVHHFALAATTAAGKARQLLLVDVTERQKALAVAEPVTAAVARRRCRRHHRLGRLSELQVFALQLCREAHHLGLQRRHLAALIRNQDLELGGDVEPPPRLSPKQRLYLNPAPIHGVIVRSHAFTVRVVQVRPRHEQQRHTHGAVVGNGLVQGGPAVVVPRVHVGPGIDQLIESFPVAPVRGHEHGLIVVHLALCLGR